MTHLFAMHSASWFSGLLDILLKSAVLLALAGVAVLACWRASAAQRHLILTLAVIGVLLLPILSTTLPAWHILRWSQGMPTPQQVRTLAPVTASPLTTPVVSGEPNLPSWEPEVMPTPSITSATSPAMTPTGEQTVPSSRASAPAFPAPSRSSVAWLVCILLAWGIGTVLVLAWTLYGAALAHRLRRRAHLTPEAWANEMPAGVRILASDDITVPVVVGILHQTILLPRQANDWPEERRRVVLLHELAHIQRRDLLAHLCAQLACALYWMNPLVWVAAYRMCVERETACDDAVLGTNIRASDYAAHLLAIASVLQGQRLVPAVGIAMARTTKVGKRIRGVLDGRRNRRGVTPLAVGIMLLFAIPGLGLLAAAQQPGTVQAPARIPLPKDTELVVISPDGAHVAFVEKIADGQRMVVDGQPGQVFPRIRAPWMRYDAPGDGLQQARPQLQLHSGIFFSADGTRLAYVVSASADVRARQAVVVDGKAAPFYDEVTIPTFSPDGKHLAYAARNGNQWMVVLDGHEGTPYRQLGGDSRRKSTFTHIIFSADGSRMGYFAETLDNRWHAVIDGKEGPAYQRIYELAISPDGRHVAYVAERNNRQFIVYDGGEKPTYDQVMYPTFSPDSQRFAFVARRGKTSMVVAGGYEGRAYADITSAPIFSPHSASLAYHAIQEQGGKRTAVAVLNGNEVIWRQNLTMISGMHFSSDSHRLAFTAHSPHGYTLLFVSGEGVSRNVQYAYAPVFSPDGLRVAYLIQQGRKVGVGVDATTLTTSLGDIPLYIAFSPDSRHLVAAMSTAGTAQVTMTLDGQPIGRYERIAGAEEDRESGRSDVVFFDAPDRFHFYAVKDGAVQRIDATVPAPADTSPLSISLTPLPDNATISAYEPVVMNYRTVNTSPKTIDLPAWVTEYTFRLEVYNAQGQLLVATPICDVPLDFLHTSERLKPGEGIEQTLVISAFFTFAEPGRYIVRAKQLDLAYQTVQATAEAEAEVTVLPFDAQRLNARIDQHWSEMRDKGHVYFHPKVLYSVRHNLALPALAWMVREWGDVNAARAIIRIGTPEARQLLKQLQAEPGRVGKAARDIDKLPTGINMWDIVNGTARKITPQNTATQPASPQQPVAGAPYHGLVVSLECARSYRLGEPVEFKVIEKNVGNQEVRYIYLGFPYNYHLYLTAANGKPVEKTTRTLELDDNEDHPNREREISLSATINLKPGEEYVRTYDLRQYFKSILSGSYTLQVRRTARDFIGFTPGATDRGALSLPCQFTINE